MQITERANIVLRLLAGLHAAGVTRTVIMPENAGIRAHVGRGLHRSETRSEHRFPAVEYLDMPVTSTTRDSVVAAGLMVKAGVAAIIVLGGDGTHRAVVSACGNVPIAGVSTGTNNAFPKFNEPTIVGLAVGLATMQPGLKDIGFEDNKWLEVDIAGHREIALVDVAIVAESYVGARALWRVENFRELFVAFAEPEVIGMSAIAGLLDPVDRASPQGRHVVFDPSAAPAHLVQAPIGPGLIETVGIKSWGPLLPDAPVAVTPLQGSIALDGERELSFSRSDRPVVTLRNSAFRTINLSACMKFGGAALLSRSARMAAKNKPEES
ncbi:Acetoin catabolism protein X, possible NAD kinase [hydrothermal vent metagenome]|uniref:Acetoin catabolism protein X, possible NAD kinase n=1 Tax=hydrothermal vent metagenome TaxID=652676 RepID=A0A3B0THY8_9ZZZZ